MKTRVSDQKAISFIKKKGILLTFPINNKKEPLSLWSQFFPRTPMKWEWNDDGDDRVFQMWMLMKRISDKKEVIYTKWFQGRATFISRDLFTAFLCLYSESKVLTKPLSQTAKLILETLENDSPLSTKELKKICELQGRDNEPIYSRAMKELFSRFLIVAFGEVDDGAFPSLAVGSTKLLYEDLWEEAQSMNSNQAHLIVSEYLDEKDLFYKFFNKIRESR